jgi:transmembrane sensor
MNHYNQYSSEDFIWDTDFRNWVLNPTQENYRMWDNWLEENPDRSEVIRQAREVVLALQCDETSLPDWEISARTTEIKDQIS